MTTFKLYFGKKPHPAQKIIGGCPSRFVVACCGRRFGKTEGAKIDCADVGVAQGGRWGYFTLKNATLEQVWEETVGWLKPVTKDKSEAYHRLVFKTGGIAEFWSVENEDAGLSRWYNKVFCDEWAIVKSGVMWQRNIRPTLTDKHGRAVFYSTPRGRNHFYDLYGLGLDPNFPDWTSFQFPTEANPFIDPLEIEEARKTLPERHFREEYLAEFMSDSGEVFRNIDAVCIGDVQEPKPGHVYVIGADWGRVEDFSVFSVYDVTDNRQVFLDRSNKVDLTLQANRLIALAQRWNPVAILVEENSVGGVMDILYRTTLPVVPFKTTNASKIVLVDTLSAKLEAGPEEIVLLKNEFLISELKSYEPFALPSGMTRYSAPEGRHDDCVMATMLSVYAAVSQVAGQVAIYRYF